MTIGHCRSPLDLQPRPRECGSPLVESQVPAVRRVAQQLEGVDERVERRIVGRHGVDDHDPAARPHALAPPRAMAAAMSGQWWALYRLTTPSKVASGKGRAPTSARTAS